MTQMNGRRIRLFLALATLLALAGCTAAAVPAAAGTTAGTANRSLTVVGNGQVMGKPDQAQVQIGVETSAPTVAEATTANDAALAAVLAAIKAQNVADSDIQTTNYSLWTEQKSGDNGPAGIAGYHVSNQVNVTIRDINHVDQVIGAATAAGANSIYGVTFTVADPASLEEQARQAAITDAQMRADDLAGLTNVALGDVLSVSEVIGSPGGPLPGVGGGFAAAEAPTISPGQLAFQVQVQVTYAIH